MSAGTGSEGTKELVRRQGRRAPLAVVLHVFGARAQPAPFRMESGRCVVGSGDECDLVISEQTVSRTHAELELAPEGVRLRDLDSRNGTYFLGHRVESITLGMGSSVTLGGTAQLAIDADVHALTESLYGDTEYRGMVGVSTAMRRLFGVLARLEGSLATVLVEGDSGVGKEVVAQALHEGSEVAGGPFVTVNCGAIPRELVASELFGHRRGAFTGATGDRKGAFESAHGGSLFLDEVGELPSELQPALLRALESGEIHPLGSERSLQVRVRVIAATNRDLEREVRSGGFREDLFYRLAVIRLKIPNLTERREDIEPLARRFAAELGLDDLPATVLEQLKLRAWPGNARELRNAVQAYAALGTLTAPAELSRDAAVAAPIDLARPYSLQKEDVIAAFTRRYLRALLQQAGGNQSLAARMAGLDRTHLGRLLSKYGSDAD